MTKARQFFLDRSGATAIEYSLIAGLICLVILAALTTMGTRLASLYRRVAAMY